MPSPTAAIAVASLAKTSKNIELQAREGQGDRPELEPPGNSFSGKDSDCSSDKMALVVVDQSKLQIEKYNGDGQDEEDVKQKGIICPQSFSLHLILMADHIQMRRSNESG